MAHSRMLLVAFALWGWTLPTLLAQTTAEEMKTHALGFGAILDSQNGDPHSQLARPMDEAASLDRKLKKRDLMVSAWGLHSREELLTMLDGIQNGESGSRKGFWNVRLKLLEGKMENYIPIISASREDVASAIVAATHLDPLRGHSLPLAAWDFGRYINLCRWGYVCGWLSEQEAWDRIIPAARLLQASYNSWGDFAQDYLLGRNFWNPQTGKDNETIRYTVALLNLPPKGLWSTIPWNEPLGTGAILSDTLAAQVLDHYVDPDPNGVSMDHLPTMNPLFIMLRTSVDPK
jgi:uncharacterized protein DUF1266